MRFLILGLLLTGCAFRAGPVEVEFWKYFNIDLTTGIGSICIGCLETESEEDNVAFLEAKAEANSTSGAGDPQPDP